MDNFIVFTIDTHKYLVSKNSLNKFKNSLLYKVTLENYSHPDFFVDNNTVYIDRDPISFSYIVDKLRGYDIDYITDPRLKNKVSSDMKYYGLEDNGDTEVNTTEGLINFYNFMESQKIKKLNDDIDEITSEVATLVESISDSSKEYGNTMETFLLKLSGGRSNDENLFSSINSISVNEHLQNIIKMAAENRTQMTDSDTSSMDFGDNYSSLESSEERDSIEEPKNDDIISQSISDKAKVRYIKIE